MIWLNKHSISASIAERYASISYEFEFENKSDIDDMNRGSSSELKFEITIDPQAFISGFTANIDGELFIGKTKEKKTAQKEYISAKEKNENAILICQPYPDIANIFEIKTNIDSNSKIVLNIEIEEYLQKKFNFNELSIEILKEFYKYNIKKNYDAISFNLKIMDKRGIYEIELPTNNEVVIDENRMNKNNTLCIINGKMKKNSKLNEFSLKYKIKGEQNESNILFDPKSQTFVHVINDIISDSTIININNQSIQTEGDNENKENNMMMMIPRRVIFVVDKSGSMSGSKWDKTISATITALKQLRIGFDRYGIIFFDDQLELSSNIGMNKILADQTNIAESISYVKNQQTGGSTDINKALLKGIDLIKTDIKLMNSNSNSKEYNFFMNQLVLITDGEPNSGVMNTNTIISNVMQENKLSADKYSSNKISIFCFGVGSDKNDSSWIKDLNHSFLKLLSLNNDGIYKRIKESECETQLNEYFNILSKPILSNINIKYEGINDLDLDLTKTSFNTLYAGNDIIICGQLQLKPINKKLIRTITANISAISGKQSKLKVKPIEINKTIKISLNDHEMDDEKEKEKEKEKDNIERIWAYLKLKQFAENKLICNDMIEYDEDEDSEKIALSLALKYKFVTPWTSMIVVKHKINEENEEKDEQQNEYVFEQKQEIDENVFDAFDKMDLQSRSVARIYNKMDLRCMNDMDDMFDGYAYAEDNDWCCFEEELCEGMMMMKNDDEKCGGLDNDEETITLTSGGANPVSFEINKRYVESSKFCTTIFEGDADATSIEIRSVDAEILKLVLHYLRNYENTDISVWDAKKWIESFDLITLSKIIFASDYMDIQSLNDLESDARDRKEKQMNMLIYTKMSNMDKIPNITLKSCSVTNMVYLIKKILLNKEFNFNQQQKDIICKYFVENTIDGTLFKLQTEKNEFVKNITDFIQANFNDKKNQVPNELLKLFQTKVLQVSC